MLPTAALRFSCSSTPSAPTQAIRSASRKQVLPARLATNRQLALPALLAGVAAAQLSLLPAPAHAQDADMAPLHTECVARRHARAAAACVSTAVAGRPVEAAPAVFEAEPGAGEPSKAQLMAERRARLQAGAAQLSVMLAGVVDGAAPPGDNPFKALMPGQ